MTTNNIFFKGVRIVLVATFWCAALMLIASAAPTAANEFGMSDELFCTIDSPLSVRVANSIAATVEDRLSNTIIIENTSNKHIGGLSVAVGVFTAGELTHIYVAESDKTVAPHSRESTIFAADISVLPAGEYTYEVVVEQGGIANVIAELQLSDQRDAATLTKTTAAKEQLQTQVNINGTSVAVDEVSQFDRGEKITVESVVTNVSSLPLFNAHIDVLLSESEVPFGDAVITHVHDEAKLFPGSKRSTKSVDNTVTPGPFTIYVIQHIPDTLTQLTSRNIQVGDIQSHGYATRMSHVGVGERVGDTDLEVAVCLEELRSGETYRDQVESVAIQLSQLGSDYSGEVLSNIDNVVEVFTTMPALGEGVSASVAMLAASTNVGNESPLFTKQTIDFGFDCERHDVCEGGVADVAAEFVQTETVQTSLWFYTGIIIGALLALLLIVRRMKSTSEPEEVEMHMPEEDS